MIIISDHRGMLNAGLDRSQTENCRLYVPLLRVECVCFLCRHPAVIPPAFDVILVKSKNDVKIEQLLVILLYCIIVTVYC